jgi:cold shock CspA family protein
LLADSLKLPDFLFFDVTDAVFVHHSSIMRCNNRFKSLAAGETVEFVLEKGSKGYKACDVTGPDGTSVVGYSKACLDQTFCCGFFDQFGAFVPYYADLAAASMQWPPLSADAGCCMAPCLKYSPVEMEN